MDHSVLDHNRSKAAAPVSENSLLGCDKTTGDENNDDDSHSINSDAFAEESRETPGGAHFGDGDDNDSHIASSVPFLPDMIVDNDSEKPYPPLRQSTALSSRDSTRCTGSNSTTKVGLLRSIAYRANNILGGRPRSMMVESKHIEMGSMRTLFRKNTEESRIKRDGCSLIKSVGDWGLRQWIGYCFWLILALAIQLSIGINGSWAFPDGRDPVCIDISTDGMDFGGNVKNKSMCLLEKTLSDGADSLRILSAFILGGFLVGSVQLWLDRRRNYAEVCGATRNLLINICSIIPNPVDRKLFARWAVLGFELAVLKGRDLIDSEEGRAYLDKLHLIEGDEWLTMVNGDRHTTVWFWIQVKAEKLRRKNEIQGLEFQTICQAITLSRDKANDLMGRINRDQPLPYTFVCGVLINMNLFLLSLSTGIKWAIWM